MGPADGWGAGWLEGRRTRRLTSLGTPTGCPSLTSSSLALGGPSLGALWGPTQLPTLHRTQLAGLHHDRGQPLAQPRALLPGTHHGLQGGWAGSQSNGRPELHTACLACPALSTGRMRVPNLSSLQGQVSSCACVHIPQRVVALPLPPWSWGTQHPGHTEPTWAQPSGPFHRRACGGKGQGHTVGEPGLCASPAGSLPQQARLLPGVSLRALGLLPAW